MGGNDGRRRALLGNGVRGDEHDGQHRRRIVHDRRRVSARVDVEQLEPDVLHLRRDLPVWRSMLAVSRFAFAGCRRERAGQGLKTPHQRTRERIHMRSTFFAIAAAAAIAVAPAAQTPAKPPAGKTLDIYISDTEGGKATLFVAPN